MDPVDVVGGVEQMAFDVVGRRDQVERPPLEEDDRHLTGHNRWSL